jgi:hypothetical protein
MNRFLNAETLRAQSHSEKNSEALAKLRDLRVAAFAFNRRP